MTNNGQGDIVMNRSLATLMTSIIMLFAVAGAVNAAPATPDPVFVLTELSYEPGEFDAAFRVGRLTAGDLAVGEYRIVEVPLSDDLGPIVEVPQSVVLTALLDTVRDYGPFAEGEVSAMFAVKEDSYAVALRFNVEAQVGEVTFYPGSIFTWGCGKDVDVKRCTSDEKAVTKDIILGTHHTVKPIVRALPVTILMVDEKLLGKLERDIPVMDLPAVGDFVMAHVAPRNDDFRIISLALTNTAMVWTDTIEDRDPSDLYGDPAEYQGTDTRPVSTPIPAIITVRPLAVMPLEERLQMWLDGKIAWDETNCFTLEGECYRQGYDSITYAGGPLHGAYGTFLGVAAINGNYIVYVGYTSKMNDRYFVPFTLGRDATNALGVVIMPTPTVEGQNGLVGHAPWLEGLDIADFLNPYIGSPVGVAVLVSDIDGLPTEVANRMSQQYPQANDFAEWMFEVTMGDGNLASGPWYINTILTNDERADDLVAAVSITFGRYV